MNPHIGVLAMQGDFEEHVTLLSRIDVDAFEVRTLAQLAACDGLIIPGGESTTMARLLIAFELMQPLRDRIADGMPVWGTCAGAIMLANDVPELDRPPLGAMDIRVKRNAFGRQIDSFEADLEIEGIEGAPMHAVFIRAPVIEAAGPNVDVLAQLEDGRIVACREGAMLATSFHPELTADTRFHALFASIVSERMRNALTAEEATA